MPFKQTTRGRGVVSAGALPERCRLVRGIQKAPGRTDRRAAVPKPVTAWIISALGFKVDIAAFALPLLAFGIPLLFSQKSNRKSVGEFIFGFSFLFMGLSYLKNNAPDLSQNPDMLSFVQDYTDMGFILPQTQEVVFP